MTFLSIIRENRNLIIVLVIFVLGAQYSNIGIVQQSFQTETKQSNVPSKSIDNDIPQRAFKKWEGDFPCFIADEANANQPGSAGKCICTTSIILISSCIIHSWRKTSRIYIHQSPKNRFVYIIRNKLKNSHRKYTK